MSGKLAMIVIFLIVVIVIEARNYRKYSDKQRQLNVSGVFAQGTVIDLEYSPPTPDFSSYYGITYEFTVGKSRYSRTMGVDRSTYNSLKKGDSVDIIYVPSDPAISRLASDFPKRADRQQAFHEVTENSVEGEAEMEAMEEEPLKVEMVQHRIRPTTANVPLMLGVGLVVLGIFLACVAEVTGFSWYAAVGIPAVGVFLFIIGVKEGNPMRAFENSSRTTKAVVLDRNWEDRYGYSVTVQFDAGEKQVTLRAKVSMEVFHATEKGPTLTIRYNYTNPRIALLKGEW